VKRGVGDTKKKDHDLSIRNNLTRITTERKEGPTFIEVFIEGKRSRDRTFIKPKTGFLRSVVETTEGQETVVLPLTINYEGLSDQTSLANEASHGLHEEMSLRRLMNWMRSVFAGNVNIGRVYISASENMVMPKSDNGQNIQKFAYAIQSRHQSRVMVSNYHIKSASLALELSEEVVLEALLELGCQIWPESSDYNMATLPRTMPENREMLWASMLQFGHLLGPFIAISHPMWSF
jgi:hypothetical protein